MNDCFTEAAVMLCISFSAAISAMAEHNSSKALLSDSGIRSQFLYRLRVAWEMPESAHNSLAVQEI